MEINNIICGVVIENTTCNFDKIFHYKIPDNFKNIQPGCRVMVPFGRGNRMRQGMVMYTKLQEKTKKTKLKNIEELLDDTPIITEEMLSLVKFMKDRYFCTYYDCIKTMLPAGINYKINIVYSVNLEKVKYIENLKNSLNNTEKKDNDKTSKALKLKENSNNILSLSNLEIKIISYVEKSKNSAKKDEIIKNIQLKYEKVETAKLEKAIKNLENQKILIKSEEAFRQILDAKLKMVSLTEKAKDETITFTKKQTQVVELLQNAGKASVKEVCYYTGVTQVVIDAVVKKGAAVYFEEEKFRIPENISKKSEYQVDLKLTEEQEEAYNNIYKKYKSGKPSVSLLYGITGSGKTSVFMKLIEKVYKEDKGIIVMVPEIGLTPQMIKIFSDIYGKSVAVFHSGLSLAERMDEYKRVQQGYAKIVIGTRSAVFAPFKNIGLIIIDEEQEDTYKSERTPRYHARDVAKFRCTKNNCLLLLSSATPDVESFYAAKQNIYSKHTLKNRYGGAILPEVTIADMNLELEAGNTSSFSSTLLESIEKNIKVKKQSIILINRRGYNTFVICKSCKEPFTCPNCSISLTYHSANKRLMCHYCGYSIDYTKLCPSCSSDNVYFGGSGTQRAEEELFEFFPKAKILRLDTDATMTKHSHEEKLSAFAKGEYDVLVGTQMVAKGLDFPNVTLVGVISADQMLYSDDYRSYERTFSLLTQVVGRSGRGKEKGTAIIQTFTPENPVISMAANQDYNTFYDSEILIRKAMLYPPFVDISMVGFVGNNQGLTMKSASVFLNILVNIAKKEYKNLPLRILRPSAALVSKVNNKFRYRIIIKCRNNNEFREMIKKALFKFNDLKDFSRINVYIDMNPLYF